MVKGGKITIPICIRTLSNNIDNILPKALINTNLFLNKEISMGKVIHSCKQLKNDKAVGPDRIPNEFIKNAPDNVLKLIMNFLT